MNSLLCLTNKIILGTCAWLWGDKFLQSKHATYLRNSLKKVAIEEVIEMNTNEKHLTLSDMPEEDALNNQPHHSVLIGKLGNKVVGLVNLFGSYESLTVVGDYDEKFKDWLAETGVIIISKSTANEVIEMTWEEYEKFKSSAKNWSTKSNR